MSAKERLRDPVDRLTDEEAKAAWVYLHQMQEANGEPASTAADAVDLRSRPSLIAGRDIVAQRPHTGQELAAEQGVRPIAKFEDILGDAEFGPDDETVDEMVATIRAWRRQRA